MAANKGRAPSTSPNQQASESSFRPGEQRAGSPGSPGTPGSRGAMDNAQNKATQVTERVAQGAQSTFQQTKSRVADQVRSLAHALDKATDHLRTEDQSGLADRAKTIGRKVEDAAQYLQQKSARELTDDLDRLARRNPAWFLGTAFVLGLLGARFLKSSERSNRETMESPRYRSSGSLSRGSLGGEVGYGTP